MIDGRAIIDPRARIGNNVEIGPWTIVGADVEIGDGTHIASHVVLKGPTRIGRNNRIYQFATVGEDTPALAYGGEPTWLEIGDNNVIREGVTIHRGLVQDQGRTIIGNHCLLMAYVHVGHDCVVGDHVIMANNASIAGHVIVGEHANFGGYSGVAQFRRVGAHAHIAAMSLVIKDVPAYMTVAGNPANVIGLNLEGMRRRGFDKAVLQAVKDAHRLLYRSGLTASDAQAQIDRLAREFPAVAVLLDSVRDSRWGNRAAKDATGSGVNGVALRLGVVAGETSGDQLGAGLMAALREQCAARGQAVSFVGIGGEEMLALGLQSIAPLSALSVSGFVDPIRHLPRVLGVLRRLLRSFREQPPDAVVGIDFNVFNLFMERRLKRAGVPTVHYVSPSVYGWRPGRVRSMPNSADLLLCLYPFEPPFYQGLAMRAAYVGHPLCQALNAGAGNETQRQAMKATLGLPGRELIALLPGSRRSEIRHMAPLFLDAAERLAQTPASRHFLLPCVREDLRRELELLLAAHPRLPVTLLAENARRALVACDGALIKSGTGTLEALCLGRPMVVSYRVGRWSYQLAKRLIRTPYVALPNILAGRAVVPELLQDEATPERLAASLEDVMQRARLDPAVLAPLGELRESLAVGEGANVEAARAILTFLDGRSAR